MSERFEIHQLLHLDPEACTAQLCGEIRDITLRRLGRQGGVVSLSGGIDSSVTAALAVRALGADRVLGLPMPERESSETTRDLSRLTAEHLGIRYIEEDITDILEACGCYGLRDAAVRALVPGYGPGYRCKLVNANLLETGATNVFSIVVETPEGEQIKKEPSADQLRQIIAASNFKQRVRKMLEYHYADRYQYAAIATSNRQETELGFYVKLGDGAGDVKPIVELFKSQVFLLGHHLGLPAAILDREPTPDTYPIEHTAEEFYFAVPYETLDLCLLCRERGYAMEQVAEVTGLTLDQVQAVMMDIVAKRSATAYLGAPPLAAALREESHD